MCFFGSVFYAGLSSSVGDPDLPTLVLSTARGRGFCFRAELFSRPGPFLGYNSCWSDAVSWGSVFLRRIVEENSGIHRRICPPWLRRSLFVALLAWPFLPNGGPCNVSGRRNQDEQSRGSSYNGITVLLCFFCGRKSTVLGARVGSSRFLEEKSGSRLTLFRLPALPSCFCSQTYWNWTLPERAAVPFIRTTTVTFRFVQST